MIRDSITKFVSSSLFDACTALLGDLHISFSRETAAPIKFEDYYEGAIPKLLQHVLDRVKATYFIGVETDLPEVEDADNPAKATRRLQGKYSGMFFFAVDMDDDKKLTRSEMASLTRGFNRISRANPVILFIRQGKFLTMSTCERMEYNQQWRDGEKLGRVSMLRYIDCTDPHRGHTDILESLACGHPFSNFDELYKHWMEVFSSEILTENFYNELSNWFAWAVEVVRFPNDITSGIVDEKLNNEAVIRMITRLIFVWFLRCKSLIPKELFDEKYIRENLIDNFAPNIEGNSLGYNPERSTYYRAILQNLFFATLNCPIIAEGKTTPNNRRFRQERGYKNIKQDQDINNLMRYEHDFMPGGAEKFLRLVNSTVPFLNGGLFDCIDDKPNGKYYEGFSERTASLKRLYVPDYLFFGGTNDTNLCNWINKNENRHVRVKGIIDLFKCYHFTVEENTPLEQDVALDPELLGKTFENLLAAYIPETGKDVRKMTASFYTPREIVQYMVDESLVAHLKRACGDEYENDYRRLLSYNDEEVVLDGELRKDIMKALYNCRVLDPACGSGAFPMGMLQQMVHVLKRIDPDNTLWKELMIDIATKEAEQAFRNDDEKERRARLDDIESAFNQTLNDPDYARKLYLIEHCVFGVDIQPAAIQISKLRVFISLIVDQHSTTNSLDNFGIRPLPNLEAKFVAANTLIPINYDSSLVDGNQEVRKYKDKLKELNHKIYLARQKSYKYKLKDEIKATRKALAEAIKETGFVQSSVASQLAEWDMFDQHNSSSYFDAEWMFGVKGGFDVVIANPPYKVVDANDPLKPVYNSIYEVARGGKRNLFYLFYERGIINLKQDGVLSYITPDTYLSGNDTEYLRKYLVKHTQIRSIVLYSEKDKVFKNVTQSVAVMVLTKGRGHGKFPIFSKKNTYVIEYDNLKEDNKYIFKADDAVIAQMNKSDLKFDSVCNGKQGDINLTLKKSFFTENQEESLPLVRGSQISKYTYRPGNEFCKMQALSRNQTSLGRIVLQEVSNQGLKYRVNGTILKNVICGHTCNVLLSNNDKYSNELILGILNSTCVNYYFKFYNQTNHVPIGELKKIPFPNNISDDKASRIEHLVKIILKRKRSDVTANITMEERCINFIVYHLYGLTYDEVLIVEPQTSFSREEYDNDCINAKQL